MEEAPEPNVGCSEPDCNQTRALSLMAALRVNSGTAQIQPSGGLASSISRQMTQIVCRLWKIIDRTQISVQSVDGAERQQTAKHESHQRSADKLPLGRFNSHDALPTQRTSDRDSGGLVAARTLTCEKPPHHNRVVASDEYNQIDGHDN
jgi:hypothetical protein